MKFSKKLAEGCTIHAWGETFYIHIFTVLIFAENLILYYLFVLAVICRIRIICCKKKIWWGWSVVSMPCKETVCLRLLHTTSYVDTSHNVIIFIKIMSLILLNNLLQVDDWNDPVLSSVRRCQLFNTVHDRVKVILYLILLLLVLLIFDDIIIALSWWILGIDYVSTIYLIPYTKYL